MASFPMLVNAQSSTERFTPVSTHTASCPASGTRSENERLRRATRPTEGWIWTALPAGVITMLATCPGAPVMATDFVMWTVPVLKFAESRIQISPPSATALSAAGSRRHGAATVQGFASLPVEERYARKSSAWANDGRSKRLATARADSARCDFIVVVL